MPINSDKTPLWKADIARSVDFYNDRFLRYALATYRKRALQIEEGQYESLRKWLLRHGYRQVGADEYHSLDKMPTGSFSIPRAPLYEKKKVNIMAPKACVVRPANAAKARLVVVIEAKSSISIPSIIRCAKRDARKYATVKAKSGKNFAFLLLLCGYFDGYYLGPQAAEGVDWIWQHRLNDLNATLPNTIKSMEALGFT
jgi:type II restriction enzyme